MEQTEFLNGTLHAIAEVYRSEADVMGPHTARTLVITPPTRPFPAPHPGAMDADIRQVLASSPHPAAAAALAEHNLIPWGSNPVEGNTEDEVAAMISVATLMSPEGPIPAPDVRLGLVYMRPDSYYPLHLHDADETYVIIAGRALWTAGDDIRMRVPGNMIHHPSLMPHAFRTGPEGFVALWRWSGDINTRSYTFIEPPEMNSLA